MQSNDEQILKTLTVETLRVYNYFLKHNPAELTLEQLSSGLGLTKPTILHHIEKLTRVGLIEDTVKGYKVKEVVKISVIKGMTRQFEKLLLTWIPLIVIFMALGFISALTITQIELKAMALFGLAIGILICIKEVKQMF